MAKILDCESKDGGSTPSLRPNCYNCKHCIQKRNKNYSCLFKKCQMGKEPYYPKEIPSDAFYYYGMKVCDYTPKR